MSNYYAAGYQDALTKLAATRWERVFRESPEILEDAISSGSKMVKRDKQKGIVTPLEEFERLTDLVRMQKFIQGKDRVLKDLKSKKIAPTDVSIGDIAHRMIASKKDDRKFGGIGYRHDLRQVQPVSRKTIDHAFKRLIPPDGLSRAEHARNLMRTPDYAPLSGPDNSYRMIVDDMASTNPVLPPFPPTTPVVAAPSNLKRNLLIGGGTLAGLGGATGIALPLALRDKEKTAADYSEEPGHSDARISRIRSALGGALTGAGLGVVPAYMGALHPKAIASIAGLGALAGGVSGALFPHRSTESRWGDIVIGEGIPTATSLVGGVGGAALGHKLFKGHMLGRALFGFPGAVLGGFGGSALARKLLESKVPESTPQMKEASAMSTDLMRFLLDDLLKQAELKEEKTKSLHAPKYDRRMKFSTALERSGHQASSEAPANEKTATDPAFDFAGVTGREGTVSVEDELIRTPPLPTEEPMSYDMANKPVMQKESAEDEMQPEQAPDAEPDMYSFTQRHPMLLPLLLGLGGAAVGAVPGALLGGRLSARSAIKAHNLKSPLFSIPAKDLARQRLYGRLTGGAVGGLLAGSGGLLGGTAMNRRQPWEE